MVASICSTVSRVASYAINAWLHAPRYSRMKFTNALYLAICFILQSYFSNIYSWMNRRKLLAAKDLGYFTSNT